MQLPLIHLDIIFLIVIVFALLRGAIRGFVTEILSMAAIIVGIAAAVLFSSPLSTILAEFLGESFWNQIIAFLILFLATYLLIKVIEGLIHSGVEKLRLGKLDRVLGFLLGALEGLLVVCLVLVVLQVQPFFNTSSLLTRSYFAKLFLPFLVPATNWLNSRGG